jgi:hypothetical protein
VGLIGNGKTMLAVDAARQLAKRRGAVLASNIWIEPPAGVPFVQLSVGEDGLSVAQMEQLMDDARASGRGCVILIDEIGIIMPARFWQSFPIALMYRISQSRKYATDLLYTSQDVEDVDAYLRRKTQWVFKVRCFPSPSAERREKGRRPWLIIRTQWRPATIEKKDKRVDRTILRYRRDREAVYDTDELVRPPSRLSRRRGSPPPITAPVAASGGLGTPQGPERSGGGSQTLAGPLEAAS